MLNLQYTTIVAPQDGVLGQRQVKPGELVGVGSQITTLTPLPDVWVIANYKETQLTHMAVGQKAEIRVDTFPGHRLRGHVLAFAPGSGAEVALLPPDNATGRSARAGDVGRGPRLRPRYPAMNAPSPFRSPLAPPGRHPGLQTPTLPTLPTTIPWLGLVAVLMGTLVSTLNARLSTFGLAEARTPFALDSWAEHLRQHERVTKADRELQQRIRRLTQDEPVVTHLIFATSASPDPRRTRLGRRSLNSAQGALPSRQTYGEGNADGNASAFAAPRSYERRMSSQGLVLDSFV